MWKMLLTLMVSRPSGRLGWLFFLLPVLRGPMLVRVVLMAIAYAFASRRDERKGAKAARENRIREDGSAKGESLPW